MAAPARAAIEDGRGEVIAALGRLDQLLARALARAEATYGAEAAGDRFRGMHVELSEVERLLARAPAAPLLSVADGGDALPRLGEAFGLDGFDRDVLVIALAPDLDLRYERVYAYLQDDITRRRATVNLALDLLCGDAGEKLARRRHFAPDAPLLSHHLLELVPDPDAVAPPLLGHMLRADDQIVELLAGAGGLDARLAGFCRLLWPAAGFDDVDLAPANRRALARLAARDAPLRLYFEGPPGSGRARAAEAHAFTAERPLIAADLAGVEGSWPAAMRVLFREAALHGAVLSLTGIDAVLGEDRGRHLLRELARAPGTVILCGSRGWRSAHAEGTGTLGVHVVGFPIPEASVRRDIWQHVVDGAGLRVGRGRLDALADRFRLTPQQIREAVVQASAAAGWRGASAESARSRSPLANADDLFAAARAQTGHDLEGLAVKTGSAHEWADIVLPEDAVRQLEELYRRVVHRERVMTTWGFGASGGHGRGVAALFAGPPGTGKTMAAEIIARALGVDLYRIDLAGVVSKWIGETEKNLSRIFAAAENANAVLLFDEAEALFGKRSEVRDSHDRYANVEIAYLLQRLERHDGVAILATNQADEMDEAFTRRLAFVIRFPLPEPAERLRIWRAVWPAEVELAADVDLPALAAEMPFTGAEIRNSAVAAAFLAAEAGGGVTAGHIRHAVRREYEKLGRTLPDPP